MVGAKFSLCSLKDALYTFSYSIWKLLYLVCSEVRLSCCASRRCVQVLVVLKGWVGSEFSLFIEHDLVGGAKILDICEQHKTKD